MSRPNLSVLKLLRPQAGATFHPHLRHLSFIVIFILTVLPYFSLFLDFGVHLARVVVEKSVSLPIRQLGGTILRHYVNGQWQDGSDSWTGPVEIPAQVMNESHCNLPILYSAIHSFFSSSFFFLSLLLPFPFSSFESSLSLPLSYANHHARVCVSAKGMALCCYISKSA